MSAPSLRSAGTELAVTVGLPTLILWFGTDALGPAPALALALAFPLGWLLVGVARTRRIDRLAAIALIGIAITGGTSLLQLDPKWIALKEALIPSAFAVALAASCATRSPFLGALLEPLLDNAAVEPALAAHQAHADWRMALVRGTLELSLILFASAGISAGLAWWLLDATPGTSEFNTQLGRLNTVGLFAVNLPVAGLATWRLSRVLTQLEALTGLAIEQLIPAAAERSR